MNERIVTRGSSNQSVIATNKVLRNTYFLLSLTLLFSAVIAGVSFAFQLPYPGIIITLVGFYGLLFLIEKNKNSSLGLLFTFALTGFMGYTLGPILNSYVTAGLGGIIMPALGATALSFLAASAYALTTKRDLSFLGGLMLALFVVLVVGMIASFLIQMPIFHVVLSSLFAIFSTMAILLTTQAIIRGGETNYISATVTLYVSIYNLFLSLLSILGFANND